MHYIRLLRPPVVQSIQSKARLKLVLTITTDLGESFLFPDKPLKLVVGLENRVTKKEEERIDVDGGGTEPTEKEQTAEGESVSSPPSSRRKEEMRLQPVHGSASCLWRPGTRGLKLDLSLPPLPRGPMDRLRLTIRPEDDSITAIDLLEIGTAEQGLIMPLWAEFPLGKQEFTHVALRELEFRLDGDRQRLLTVEEEIGESIARHVWDAGVMTVAMVANLLCGHGSALPALRTLLLRDHLSVLELGSGVGILGIGIATILRSLESRSRANFRLTDLPAAGERARANISRYSETFPTGALAVEYEDLDWEDGRKGVFPDGVQSTRWNLIVLSDCTYNVDMLPALVETLSTLHASSAVAGHVCGSAEGEGPKVLLATKPRHPSEKALFDLMSGDDWTVVDKVALPLPVLCGNSESVEVYLFGKE